MNRTSMKQTAAYLAIAILLLTTFSAAQPSGSPYTRLGIGDLNYFSTGSSMGMGGAGTALSTSNNIDLSNPAAWSYINLTRFSLSANYRGITASDASTSTNYGNFNFNGAMAAIPLSTGNGIVVAFGLTPYSSVGYTI